MFIKKLLEKTGISSPHRGGVARYENFYKCLDCGHVWNGPCPRPCQMCRSTNITRCSELIYLKYIGKPEE